MDEFVISVAKDFSRTPGPRFIKDGPFSGEKFFKQHLRPAFKKYENIVVVLDGTEGFGSSFLNQAFRSLVTESGLTVGDIEKRLRIISNEDELYREDAWDSVSKALKS